MLEPEGPDGGVEANLFVPGGALDIDPSGQLVTHPVGAHGGRAVVGSAGIGEHDGHRGLRLGRVPADGQGEEVQRRAMAVAEVRDGIGARTPCRRQGG